MKIAGGFPERAEKYKFVSDIACECGIDRLLWSQTNNGPRWKFYCTLDSGLEIILKTMTWEIENTPSVRDELRQVIGMLN